MVGAMAILASLPPSVQYAGQSAADARGGLPAVSRFRLVAAGIIPILVVTACSTAAPSSPPSQAAASEAPATAAASASAAAADFTGVTVNLLTFNGPQVAEPLQRRAPDFEK